MPDSEQRFANFFGRGHSFDRVLLPATIDMMEQFERFMARRYVDGYWDAEKTKPKFAIGFGHNEGGSNEPKVIPADMVVTLEEAREIFSRDVAQKIRWVNARIKVPLTQYQFGAIVSLVYQYGEGRVERESKLVETLNAGEYVWAATRQMLSLNKKKDGTESDGHTYRRCIEIAHYFTKKELVV